MLSGFSNLVSSCSAICKLFPWFANVNNIVWSFPERKFNGYTMNWKWRFSIYNSDKVRNTDCLETHSLCNYFGQFNGYTINWKWRFPIYNSDKIKYTDCLETHSLCNYFGPLISISDRNVKLAPVFSVKLKIKSITESSTLMWNKLLLNHTIHQFKENIWIISLLIKVNSLHLDVFIPRFSEFNRSSESPIDTTMDRNWKW